MIDFLDINQRRLRKEEKKKQFELGLQNFESQIKDAIKPQRLFKEHPQLLLGGLIAGGSFIKLMLARRAAGLRKLVAFASPLLLKTIVNSFLKKKN